MGADIWGQVGGVTLLCGILYIDIYRYVCKYQSPLRSCRYHSPLRHSPLAYPIDIYI
jgi:hypothetical protein